MKKRKKLENGNNVMKNTIISVLVTTLSFIAILVCSICDLAILGKFTWSIITTSSILFAWLVLIPTIKLGVHIFDF